MADDPPRPESDLDEYPVPGQEVVLTPPRVPPIVSDTASAPLDEVTAASQVLPGDSTAESGVHIVSQRRIETRIHIGPLPDPDTLRELASIYPGSPKLIFEEFRAQSAHRRDLERQRMNTSTTLAIRGQAIGGALGGIGLIGSLVVAGMGQGWAGFGIALTSLVSLVSVFVYGREQQKKERIDKAEQREKMMRGEPPERIEESLSQ